METIVVYTANTSNRLKYVLDWLLKERMQANYRIVTDLAEVAPDGFFISYGTSLPGSISIPDEGLLWGKGITKTDPQTGMWQDIPTIFATAGAGYSLPFDLFSAIFYLLSRYEEYYPFAPDKHGRYPATDSILYKKGWLLLPVADEWCAALRKQLPAASPTLNIESPHFSYQPTYDIDIAYSHLYKGVGRIMGAYMRAMLKGDVKQINERTKVLKNKQKDPFDSFRWLRQLHKEYDCKPLYFVLSSMRTTRFDKNIHPRHPAMVRVIKNITKDGVIGIHPSYYSEQGDTFSDEKKALEQVAGLPTTISRQHYIRIKTPDTWRLLLANGITADYSMGYGGHLGFRAGTGSSFYWYDVLNESITRLRVHPFCFMDTTAHYEAKLSVTDAFTKLNAMSALLEKTDSTLTTIFHNFSLGTANEWKGWRQAYEHFLMEKSRL
jgi:hypothetical protein